MNERIKSCPFCGSRNVEVARTNRNACWIACGNYRCGAEAKSHPTRNGAIRNWNRRAKITTTETKIVEDMDREQQERAALAWLNQDASMGSTLMRPLREQVSHAH